MNSIILDDKVRMAIEAGAKSGSCLCWTCSTCDGECPINIATGRMQPQTLVRMANFGMLEELLLAPQIWYCLGCQRCALGCPNNVKPYELMHYLRLEAFRTGRVDPAMKVALWRLVGQFQRVRYRTIQKAMGGRAVAISEREWYQWFKMPIRNKIFQEIDVSKVGRQPDPMHEDRLSSRVCLTCDECTACCPIFYERACFDPQSIIRMVSLGLTKRLLKSASIWMCLECRQCTQTCSQQISGHAVIRQLRTTAIEQGFVPEDFQALLSELNRQIYPRFLDEIDQLIGMYRLGSGKRDPALTVL